MIGKLRGLVDEQTEDSVIIDVNGVGYVVFASGRTLGSLPGAGEATELVIETHVREDHIHLYGFATSAERDWFRLLGSVQGVGAKVALAILGTLDPDTMTRAVGAQDTTAFTQVKGVGPKVAQRIVSELKSQVAKMGAAALPAPTGSATSAKSKGKSAPAAPATQDTRMQDAVSALVDLGYNRTEAFTVIAQALQNDEGDNPPTLDELIRLGLKGLAR